jgi:hypothetical protein
VARKDGRTQACGSPQARQRLAQARRYLDVAELTADTSDADLEYSGVAASIAILAGIAAADAACCAALGKRSGSDNHQDAADLLAQIAPEGKRASMKLRQLISLKDSAHYGFLNISASQLKKSMRQAEQLVEFAENAVLRSGNSDVPPRSGDLVQRPRLDLVEESPDLGGAAQGGARFDLLDPGADVPVEVEDDDLLGLVEVLGDRQRADRGVVDDPADVADHVRVALPQAEHGVGAEPGIEAGQHRHPPAGRQGQVALGKQLIGLTHRALLDRPWDEVLQPSLAIVE